MEKDRLPTKDEQALAVSKNKWQKTKEYLKIADLLSCKGQRE